ncbi:MAG: energy-coupling factor ABC transporter ATP-binding protein [Deferribacteraceae bacterium]|jgi:cobalt/nickel transport system ATP-binding protein|nr:energy-coupling factor ABC transporter ATP-binding protein [Deferribacteraceae bacterium]
MMDILTLENISYCYDDKRLALDNVSASFRAGERIAILGNNGAGKSTFFQCCNGLLRPSSGKIFYKGALLGRSKRELLALRQGIGLVFQDPDSQIIAGSVESEISFGPMNLRLPQADVAKRVDQALEQMHLDGYAERAPQYLSGGEKKRVTIADILAMQPELIMLDEPTASLDPENVAALERTLAKLSNQGIAIVIATHDVDFAYKVAERALVFAGGKIIADDDICEIFAAESILTAANLKPPLVYEAFKALRSKFNLDLAMPRSIEELCACIERI